MRIYVISIMHTGTHMLRYHILNGHYPIESPEGCYFNGDSGNEMLEYHIDKWYIDRGLLNGLEGELIFSPMRHPRRVKASFEARKRPEGEFEFQFDYFIENIHNLVTAYVFIDSDKRDSQVSNIGRILDLPLKCDWPFDQKSGHRVGTDKLSLDDCPLVDQRYIDFYDEVLSYH